MARRVIQLMIPDEVIISKIYLIRGQKVMLDRDLADLYEIETKQLKRAVRRNMDRFPDDPERRGSLSALTSSDRSSQQ